MFGSLLQKTKLSIGSIINRVYWRIVMGVCLVVFSYGIGTTALPEYRKYRIEKVKMVKNDEKGNDGIMEGKGTQK
jgi:hypothetical protein